MTNKKLLKEIDEWEKENIIDTYVADRLRERYSTKGKVTLVTIFSILSSVLIGAGVILIFATNWKNLPLAVKALVSFLPLLLGQGAAVFTVAKMYERTVIRECVTILYTAGIFATLAMVANSFDLSGDIGRYILICSVLTLPVIYVMSAVSPLAVYFAGVIFSALKNARHADSIEILIYFALTVVGILFLFRVRNEENPDPRRIGYVKWLNTAASFAFMVAFIIAADLGGLTTYLAYFALIMAFSPVDSESLSPLKFLGVIGSAVTVGVFSLGHSWYAVGSDFDFLSNLAGIIPAVLMCVAAVILAFAKGIDKLKITVIAADIVCVVLSSLCYIGFISESFILTVIANAAMLAVGIMLIVCGTADCDTFTTNAGLVTVGAVVIMRFFDWDLDIFMKGIAFICAGVVLLVVNKRLAKKRKDMTYAGEVDAE